MLERRLVAEEIGLAGGHHIDDLADEAFFSSGPHNVNEIVDGRQAFLPRQRREAAFEEIHLIPGQHDARALAQELSHELEILAVHAASPFIIFTARWPSSLGGFTASA